ncbi:aminotransferase class I/II-fold pyridoxal phosphate-dependent enzyme [Magnetospirillum sp. SS-4]|uniref:aminotransferase class I/II-fold pyridoxal phosphate-dependent enzyme n=1 Tax=Magnetospirillum sp. SS-4 TaxID=2681465 RepID=UPI00137E837D|nr:aminotransferase class I/II-fold pyridoxal phosphate-dependent enzyme [Magnetospirillum sp. SS-4]CAA7617717.1 DegT/DnrJ/EryC1/StrS aminotransferase (modular protein) [Magnetospirillum sp. SS-4]
MNVLLERVRRGIIDRIDRFCRDRAGLDGGVVDELAAVNSLLSQPLLHRLLTVRAWLSPLLPPAPRDRDGRSVVFVHNAYYHFTLMAAELRRRGWDALSLHPAGMVDHDDFLYQGQDVLLRFAADAASLLRGAQVLIEIGRRFKAIHFYGINNMVVNPHLNIGGARPETPAYPLEFEYLKRRGLKIVYSVVGCNDGISQTAWNRWTGGMCGQCRFRDQPGVCSDLRNLGWGHRLATMADLVCAEMMPRLDYLANPKVRSFPLSYPVDPTLWAPDIAVPDHHRIERQPGEVLVLHGFANQARRGCNGADPKGSKWVFAAIEQLRSEGLNVRLIFLNAVPSREVRYIQVQADIVVDQLHFGRYGAQARECLMLGKPVVGFLKPEGGESGEARRCVDECPIVNATPRTLVDVLRDLVRDAGMRRSIGEASRAFALAWHSTPSCAGRLEREYARIGLGRSRRPIPRTPMYNIPLIRPIVTQAVKDRVNAVLDSRYLSEGPATRAFEKAVSDYLGGGHVHAVTSATTGLELALRALGVGPGDEVVVPDFTYPATADAVAIVGATTVLADVDSGTMIMDFASLERSLSPRTKVVMPVSAFGNPVDYRLLNALKEKHGFRVIEDAAPALGASLDGVKVGRLADITVFSLHPRKIITTGEGGLVVTDNAEWADWINSYKHFGMGVVDGTVHPFFQRIGTNGKLSDILAAVGLAQMEMIDEILSRRRALSSRYEEKLAGIDGVTLSATTPGGEHCRQSFAIFVDDRDRILRHMRALGIEVQIGTYALHRELAFQPGDRLRVSGPLPGSLHAFNHCLVLPLYHDMTHDEQDAVVTELKALL